MIDTKLLEPIIKQIKTGAFLTTKVGNQINTMTIGWMTIGRVWETDLVTVYVRFSRYTYDFMENSNCFTVSFPYPEGKVNELREWGVKSGRDCNKLTNSDVLAARTVDGTVIKGCNVHIECEKIYDQIMDPKKLDPELHESFYHDEGDYHHIYYGKIVEMYIEDDLSLFPGQ